MFSDCGSNYNIEGLAGCMLGGNAHLIGAPLSLIWGLACVALLVFLIESSVLPAASFLCDQHCRWRMSQLQNGADGVLPSSTSSADLAYYATWRMLAGNAGVVLLLQLAGFMHYDLLDSNQNNDGYSIYVSSGLTLGVVILSHGPVRLLLRRLLHSTRERTLGQTSSSGESLTFPEQGRPISRLVESAAASMVGLLVPVFCYVSSAVDDSQDDSSSSGGSRSPSATASWVALIGIWSVIFAAYIYAVSVVRGRVTLELGLVASLLGDVDPGSTPLEMEMTVASGLLGEGGGQQRRQRQQDQRQRRRERSSSSSGGGGGGGGGGGEDAYTYLTLVDTQYDEDDNFIGRDSMRVERRRDGSYGHSVVDEHSQWQERVQREGRSPGDPAPEKLSSSSLAGIATPKRLSDNIFAAENASPGGAAAPPSSTPDVDQESAGIASDAPAPSAISDSLWAHSGSALQSAHARATASEASEVQETEFSSPDESGSHQREEVTNTPTATEDSSFASAASATPTSTSQRLPSSASPFLSPLSFSWPRAPRTNNNESSASGGRDSASRLEHGGFFARGANSIGSARSETLEDWRDDGVSGGSIGGDSMGSPEREVIEDVTAAVMARQLRAEGPCMRAWRASRWQRRRFFELVICRPTASITRIARSSANGGTASSDTPLRAASDGHGDSDGDGDDGRTTSAAPVNESAERQAPMGGPRVGGTTGEAAGSGSLLGHHHSPCEATACLFDGGLLVLSAFIPPVDPRHHRRVTFVSQAVLGPLLFVVIVWLLRSPRATSEPGDDDGASAATLTSLGVALAVIGSFGGLLAIAVAHRTRLSERDRTLPPLPKTLVSVWSLLLSATVAYLFAAWAVEGLAGFASLASLPLADPKATRNAMKDDDDDDDDDDDTRTNGAAGGVAPFLAGLFLPSLFVMALPTIDDAAAVYLSRVSPSHPTRIQRRGMAALASLGASLPLTVTAIVQAPPVASFVGADTKATWGCIIAFSVLATALALVDVLAATAEMFGWRNQPQR